MLVQQATSVPMRSATPTYYNFASITVARNTGDKVEIAANVGLVRLLATAANRVLIGLAARQDNGMQKPAAIRTDIRLRGIPRSNPAVPGR